MNAHLVGQWMGWVGGMNKGIAVLNVEPPLTKEPNFLGGRVMFTDADDTNVNFYCIIQGTITESGISGELLDFYIFDYRKKALMPAKDFMRAYPGTEVPIQGEVRGALDKGKAMIGEWKTNINTKGTFRLIKSHIEEPMRADYDIKTWSGFKEWVSENDDSKVIYRGHKDVQYRLSTAFHRHNRNDIIRYAQDDMPIIANHINAVSNYKYDLNKQSDYYALLGLIQHHGYPTPLLDWTESPYIAAFFAYEGIRKDKQDGHIRIYMFKDIEKWKIRCKPLTFLIEPRPSLTITILPSVGNERTIPQQSVFMLSNVADIEKFIQLHEATFKERYLFMIDLPVSERNHAMRDLRKMGITAGSLFPGIDGVCRSLRERYF